VLTSDLYRTLLLIDSQDAANETYKKALAMTDKAPEYYDEIQTQIQVGEHGATRVMHTVTGACCAEEAVLTCQRFLDSASDGALLMHSMLLLHGRCDAEPWCDLLAWFVWGGCVLNEQRWNLLTPVRLWPHEIQCSSCPTDSVTPVLPSPFEPFAQS